MCTCTALWILLEYRKVSAFISNIIRRQAVHTDTTWWYNEHVCRIIYICILHGVTYWSFQFGSVRWTESWSPSAVKMKSLSFISCEGVPFPFFTSKMSWRVWFEVFNDEKDGKFIYGPTVFPWRVYMVIKCVRVSLKRRRFVEKTFQTTCIHNSGCWNAGNSLP